MNGAARALTVPVELGERSYDITISEHLPQDKISNIVSGKRVFVITDDNVAPLYLKEVSECIQDLLGTFVIPAGESSKSLQLAEEIFGELIRVGADRKTVIVALGGGVVGDLTGFVAASYMRGVPFVQIPTTLLAMVDSSVGGKVAVNHPKGKNMIGFFYQPLAVFIATKCLGTLDTRQVSAGMAEVIKYGIIYSAPFFRWLEEACDRLLSLDPETIGHAIGESVKVKAEVVAQDETETSGFRSILNLGHTFGHAEEVLSGYGTVLHGEAVGAGMLVASKVAQKMGFLTVEEVDRIQALLKQCSLPVTLKAAGRREEFWKVMAGDKKAKEGSALFVIPEALGKCSLPQPLDRQVVDEVLEECR